MDPWQKESLNLKVGDLIIWRGETIETEDGPGVLSPGMRAKSFHCMMVFTWM